MARYVNRKQGNTSCKQIDINSRPNVDNDDKERKKIMIMIVLQSINYQHCN